MVKEAVCKARGLKVRYILYVFLLFSCILTLRLFHLQVEKRLVFSNLGEKNFLRTEVIPPLRGDVYDCNKVLLAANRPVYDLGWEGSGKKLTEQDEHTLATVQAILGIDLAGEDRRFAIEGACRYARRVMLKEDVTFQQLCQISEQCAGSAHLVVTNRFKRVYPHHALACHVLGYLNKAENIGQSGLESQFEEQLQGQEGYITQVINSTGRTLALKDCKEAQAGTDLTLNLDFAVQQLAETLFTGDQSGVFILMDPENGAIKAMVSYPTFDPNQFLRPITEEEWSNLTLNNPLLNRATNALYPPASTFKLITMTAGLEEGIIDQSSEFKCFGYTTFCGRRYYCMNHLGHGKLMPKHAVAVSCNIPCYHIARKVNIDRLAMYAQRFGLGQKTDFLLPEKSGLVPTTQWKKNFNGERWWRGESLSTCIGQGYLLVTPLQIARMVGAVCTGSLVKPRLLVNEDIVKSRLEISPETLHFLRSAMKEAVTDGSGRMLSFLRSFDIHVKTGTAQTCSLTKERLNRNDLEHAWVAGFFSYKGGKPLTMLVLLEHAGHSSFATQIANKFLRGYQGLMEGTIEKKL